jgi:hypothetical protein
MIGTRNTNRLFAVCFAVMYGFLIMGGIRWTTRNIALLFFLSCIVFVVLYFVGAWIGARIERNKKIPTSSKELRRRRKTFYEWLDSQERR